MILAFVVMVGIALLLASTARPPQLGDLEGALGSRWATGAFGVLTGLIIWFVWGSLNGTALYHDEAAYLFQADMFSRLRWAAPSPPIPEFFEQMYVLVTPVYAAKYPPGHALMLAPAMMLGVPGLAVVVLNGLTGALTFALARRLAGVWVALLTWLLFVLAPNTLRFRVSYFSEVTTSAMWVVAWWALVRWRERREARWLLLVAAATGWGAITRPLTMAVFAVPVAVVVLRDVRQHALWRQFAAAVGVGALVLLVLPIWSRGTLGSVRRTPLAVYTAQYLPFDVPGYTLPRATGTRKLPPDMQQTAAFLREIKTQQVTDPPLALLVARARELFTSVWGNWRMILFPAFLVGVVIAPAAGLVALATSALLLLVYLMQAHTPDWTVYYAETVPVLAFVTAAGFAWIASRVTRDTAAGGARVALAMLLVSLSVTALGARTLSLWRGAQTRNAMAQRTFHEQVASLPGARTMVFVRYAPDHRISYSLIMNSADLATAPSWIVHDRGADDLRLMRAAPDRKPWLYDEATRSFAEVSP